MVTNILLVLAEAVTYHLCLPALCFRGTTCDKQNTVMHLSEQECVCVCLVGCQMRFQYPLQHGLGNWLYTGVYFRAKGISSAENVLAVSGLYSHCISSCAAWDTIPLLCHGERRISYTRLQKLPYRFSSCVHRGSAFIFSPVKVSLTILRNNTLLEQKTAYTQMRLHSPFPFYQIQILQSASLCLSDREIICLGEIQPYLREGKWSWTSRE